MGVTTYDMEVPVAVPAAKLYQGLVLEGHNLLPKVAPHAIKSIEILEGDGTSVGSVLLVTFGEAAQHKSVKHKVDALDKDNMTYSYSIIEGDVLSGDLESISYHNKIVPTDDGGCILKSRSIYTTKGDAKLPEELIKSGKERAAGLFKAVEAHLLGH